MTDRPSASAILFDFDGTLADSFAAITASVNRVADAHGLPHFDDAHVRGLVGYGLSYLLGELFPDHDTDLCVDIYRRDHSEIARELTRLLPGALETLTELHRRGVRMAVCSNKSVRFTRELCHSLGIAEFFGAVLGPEDVPEPKPAPDMLVEATRRLGVAPSESLYVGDMSIDVETARAAGVPVWVVPTGAQSVDRLRQAAPDRILGGLVELL